MQIESKNTMIVSLTDVSQTPLASGNIGPEACMCFKINIIANASFASFLNVLFCFIYVFFICFYIMYCVVFGPSCVLDKDDIQELIISCCNDAIVQRKVMDGGVLFIY